jgi:hypothetical protein
MTGTGGSDTSDPYMGGTNSNAYKFNYQSFTRKPM